MRKSHFFQKARENAVSDEIIVDFAAATAFEGLSKPQPKPIVQQSSVLKRRQLNLAGPDLFDKKFKGYF